MTMDQIVNQKVERALGAALIRQIVLEAQIDELTKQIAEAAKVGTPPASPSKTK